MPAVLPRGIVPVVQTPFLPATDSDAADAAGGAVDHAALERLVRDAVACGAVGLLAPAVASEVALLAPDERIELTRHVARLARELAVPLIVGASSADIEEVERMAALAEEVGAAAFLVAVPARFYGSEQTDAADFAELCAYFARVSGAAALPLVVQDLEFGGPGLPMAALAALARAVPRLGGMKIETTPAGPKLTAARRLLGPDMWLAGGWAVPQMIEALDRGVDAMIPEASMVAVYSRVFAQHAAGRRGEARALFLRLLPVLAFSNQDLHTSVAFFKRLLVRRGIFSSPAMRLQSASFVWDAFNTRIADELIDLYLTLHAEGVQP